MTFICRARVQYEITQHPKLSSQLPAPILEILHIALKSHRDALNIQQDSADILFNTAQVLTSLAEALTEGKRPGDQRIHEAVKYLQDALNLFQRCLAVQELRYTEAQEHMRMVEFGNFEQQQPSDPVEQPTQSEPAGSTESEQWAAVIEPVTKSTLVDTAIAQLETLATLCSLLTSDPGASLAWIEEYSSDLRQKISSYAEGTDRQHEVGLARAKFISSIAEVSYRSGRIDIETYKNELNRGFNESLDLSQDPQGLCSKAEMLASFNSAIADTHIPQNQDSLNKSLNFRWQALSIALDCLTAASKLANAENLPKIHIARGDVEMYRWRLGRAPWSLAVSNDNGPILLKNAQTYYRGGAAIARRDGWTEEEREGTIKEALAKALTGDVAQILDLMAGARGEVMAMAEDMVEDGLVATEDMQTAFSTAEPDEIVF